MELVNFYFVLFIWVLISFKELGKSFMSACLTKTSFLVSFWSMACPLTFSWRAAVFWPCKGSIIISSLIVIWYEWLDETWAVLEWIVFIEFSFWVKILRCFYGTRRPYRVLHFLCGLFLFVFVLLCLFVLLGWWEEFS